jgi:hypothetical protein
MSENSPERTRVAADFGADPEQIRRDHLISHVLAALTRGVGTDALVFFGGTALSRTYLPRCRLSEDIDLIALRPRQSVAEAVETAVREGLARSHGRPTWRPPLTGTEFVDREAMAVFLAHGPFARPPAAWVFDAVPDEDSWRRALSHQTRLEITAAEALHVVKDAWERAGR